MPREPLSAAKAAREAVAGQLDEIRRDAGLTGQELALRCGWHKSKTSRLARARTAASDADIRAWCRACGAECEVHAYLRAFAQLSRSAVYGPEARRCLGKALDAATG
ncbi:helix-turn-helix domain-containing protein [Streptomyces albidoflavus]